jgi:nucleoside 2-deoxyribosyltransferase
MQRSRIYLAAPFFSQGELQFNEQVLRQLERWWNVFYPQRDGVRMAELVDQGLDANIAAERVWLCDFEELRSCNLVVAILDGRVPDEGVCVELGLARGLGKAVVGVRTDSRRCFSWGANPMVTGCLTSLCEDPTLLVDAVRRHINGHAALAAAVTASDMK